MPKPPLTRNNAFTFGNDQEPISRILPKDANGVPIGGNVSKDGNEDDKDNKIVLEDVEGGRRRRKTRRRKSRKTRANRKNRKTRNNY